MPTRRITRSPVKVTGTVPDGQEFESTLEEDFFVLLRFNRLVASFEAQPVTIEWRDAAKKIRTYTPDVLVRYKTELAECAKWPPLLCEVKPDLNDTTESPRRRKPPRTENESENELKWKAAERYAVKHGWEFKVFRESDIRTSYLDNARFLLRYLERRSNTKYEADLLAILAERGSMTLATWAEAASHSSEERVLVFPTCYRLIASQQVNVDLSNVLTLDSIVKESTDA